MKNFPIFILLLIVLGGLFFCFYASRAQTSGVTATIRITVCGNDFKEAEEECDRNDLGEQDCVSRGFDGGILSCNNDCTFDTSGCSTTPPPSPPSGGGSSGSVYIPPSTETKVILQGKAYPSSSITVLKDGKVAVTTAADSQANFKIQITEITAGTYTFGIWAEDKEGRKSITFSFTAPVISGTITTISDIFLPPTIELDKIGLQRGETLSILGQTAPESEVSIFINSPEEIIKKTEAEEDGTWFYDFDTTPLEDGSHTSRAKAVSPGDLTSTYSRTLSFYIGEGAGIAKQADVSKDGRVNLVDFSIILYNWGVPKNSVADLNSDGKVNIVDFSIMLYYWTG